MELDNGDLMVSNIDGRISLVRAGTTDATHINTELASQGPGIAPAGGGAVYVADWGTNSLYFLEPD